MMDYATEKLAPARFCSKAVQGASDDLLAFLAAL